ncbi:MAG: GNAT family N-acetyltransferase [Neomegalonema sp.]|nr:GNAT family N-acetyltransferase [Neomegalonema sp.]
MSTGWSIVELAAPDARSAACVEVTATLPEWFGRPESNAYYAREIGDKSVFAAISDGRVLGLVALHPHFDGTVEIWWMGVARAFHRNGVGRALIGEAERAARAMGRRNLVVQTLSPRHPDPNYAKTRLFYESVGFSALIDIAAAPQEPPLMWMYKPL